MKVTYEFLNNIDHDDYYELKVFEKSRAMLDALNEIEVYLRQAKNQVVDLDKDTIIDMIFDIIYDSGIGDIE